MPRVRAGIPARAAVLLRILFRPPGGGLRLRRHRAGGLARVDRGGPRDALALRRAAALRSRAARGSRLRLHAAAPRGPAGRGDRPRPALDQERHRQPHLVVQGSRRRRRRREGARVRLRGHRLREHRQPRQLRRRARRAGRDGGGGLHPPRSRAGQGRRQRRLRPDAGDGGRIVRRREPALHRGLAEQALGLREHQRPPLLRRGFAHPRLRGRRAAGLARPGLLRRADGVRPRSSRRSGRASASCTASA